MDTNQTLFIITIVAIIGVFIYKYIQSIFEANGG